MIIEKCKNLEQNIVGYKKRLEIENNAEALGICLESIKLEVEELSLIIQKSVLLLNKGLLKSNELPSAEKVLKKLKVVHQKFYESPINITQGNNLNLLLISLKHLRETLSSKLIKAWEYWFNEQTRFLIDDNLLNQFKNIPNFRKSINEIKDKNKKIMAHKTKVPPTQDDFEYLLKIIEDNKNLISTIPLNNLPKDVQDFLKALNTQEGANLKLLTVSVFNWLKENNLVSNYYVKPSIRGDYFGR